MQRLLIAGLIVIAMVTFGVRARAQYGPHGEYEPHSVSAVIDRVHTDLNRAYGVWHFSSGDRKRLNEAEDKLRDFAKKWTRGKFDKGELDEAIESIQHVINDNHMP